MIGVCPVIGQEGLSKKITLPGSDKGISVSTDEYGVHLNYTSSEIWLNEVSTDSGKFVKISVPGHIYSDLTGTPQLPALTRLITIPEGSRIVIKITDVRSTKLNLVKNGFNMMVFPTQESEVKSDQAIKPKFVIDRKLYRLNGFIPTDTVTLTYSGKTRGRQLANICINPVRYNPVTGDLDVISSMKVDVFFIKSDIVSLKTSQQPVPYLLPVAKGILNYNPEEVVPGYSEEPVKLIILTDTAFRRQDRKSVV